MRIFVTGSTGFLGSQIALALSEDPANEVYLLIRSRSELSAQERFQKLTRHWQRFGLVGSEQIDRLIAVENIDEVSGTIDFLINCIADTQFDANILMSRNSNLHITQDLLRQCLARPESVRFIHFSTAFVVGKFRGLANETTECYKFNNSYERTKYEAERSVVSSGLNYTILRPSIVAGHSKTGYVYHFRVFYSLMRIWMTNRLPRAPLAKKAVVDCIPIDVVTESLCAVLKTKNTENQTYNICIGSRGSRPSEIFEAAKFSFPKIKIQTAPAVVLKIIRIPLFRKWLGRSLSEAIDMFSPHFTYMNRCGVVFSGEKISLALGDSMPKIPSFRHYGKTLFSFCEKSKWGKKPYDLKGSSSLQL